MQDKGHKKEIKVVIWISGTLEFTEKNILKQSRITNYTTVSNNVHNMIQL